MHLTRAMLDELCRQYGDGFYIVDLDRFSENFHHLLRALRAHYPDSDLAYSYKTNYLPRLCRLVDQWGGLAEVVSRMEFDLARKLGVDGQRIVFNGPLKTDDDLQAARQCGALVNLDGLAQVERACELAERDPSGKWKVGVRVTFALPRAETSRFGFDADGQELGEAIFRLRRCPGMKVACLHCHFLTDARSEQDYRSIAQRMAGLADEHFPDAPPEVLNLGGGFFSPMPEELAAQFGVPIASFDQYALAVAQPLIARWPRPPRPRLVLEPGMCVVADAASFVTRVTDIRRRGPLRLAQVSGSIYDVKPSLSPRNLPIEVVTADESSQPPQASAADLVGYTCMEHDVLYRGWEGPLAVGDFVVFHNVGAYTNVLRGPFIRPAPAMLGMTAAGDVELLRRAETIEDVFATYNT